MNDFLISGMETQNGDTINCSLTQYLYPAPFSLLEPGFNSEWCGDQPQTHASPDP